MARLRSFKLRTKLILIISGIIIPLMISSLSIMSFLINRASLEFVKQDLYKTSSAFEELRHRNRQQLMRALQYVGGRLTVPQASLDSVALRGLAAEVRNLFAVHLLRIENADYHPVLQEPSGVSHLPDMGRWSGPRTSRFGLVALGNQIYQVGVLRETIGGGALGAVVVGSPIDEPEVKAIKRITNSEITILLNDAIATSTIADGELRQAVEAFYTGLLKDGAVRYYDLDQKPVNIGGESYLAQLLPLTDLSQNRLGYIAVQRSTERILNFNQGIKNALFIIIVAFWVCTGLVVGLFIQRHMVQPISKLAGAVETIARGDLSPILEIESNDEVGVLYAGFNHMAEEVRNWTQKLQEKNEELEQHSQRIVEINQEMQDFVYVVSHDLKSPLVNIQGFTGRLARLISSVKAELERLHSELARDGHDSVVTHLQDVIGSIEERGQQSFEFIHTASKKMNDMIEELLALSRVETRDMPMEMTDIGAEVDAIIKAAKYEIQEKGIDIHVGALPTILCERARINQVLTNLITNAIKFMGEEGEQQIHIGYRDEGEHHLFWVRDTGLGIDPKDHKRIFRVFYRGDTVVAGHGMGLALAKKIVLKHQGRIWLESTPGRGSTFYFTLKKYPDTEVTVVSEASTRLTTPPEKILE